MFLAKAKSSKIHPSRLRTSALLLLFLYFAGNVQFESFHQAFHAAEEHSSDEEQDPCHRAIYHDSQSEGCEHKTHVTAVRNCPLCHVVPFNEQHFFISSSFISLPLANGFQDEISEIGTSISLITPPSRGPPAGLTALVLIIS